MQSTTIGKGILKSMLQCTNLMGIDLKMKLFVTSNVALAIFAKNDGIMQGSAGSWYSRAKF